MSQQSNKPVAELRLSSCKATIWANETSVGTRHNVTFSRLYKKGEKWQETSSFGRDDLLLLAKLADMAHTHICALPYDASSASDE